MSGWDIRLAAVDHEGELLGGAINLAADRDDRHAGFPSGQDAVGVNRHKGGVGTGEIEIGRCHAAYKVQ